MKNKLNDFFINKKFNLALKMILFGVVSFFILSSTFSKEFYNEINLGGMNFFKNPSGGIVFIFNIFLTICSIFILSINLFSMFLIATLMVAGFKFLYLFYKNNFNKINSIKENILTKNYVGFYKSESKFLC